MAGFNRTVQRPLLEPYVERFFADVSGVARTKTNEYTQSFVGALFPGYRVEQPLLDRSERLLAETPPSDTVLIRLLKEANDDLAHAIACRAFAAS